MTRSRLSADRRGVAALEFAIVGAATLAAIFGVVDAGLALQQQNALDYATLNAARWAAVNGSNSASPASAAAVQARFAQAYARVAPAAAAPTPTVVFSPGDAPGAMVTVSASEVYKPVTGLSSIGVVTLTGSATLTIQN
jgi:Flp pilus assembly protein TadG